MSPPEFRVRVEKDQLVFSAGHFITITTPDGEICEHLHGHNWRVAAELAGPLDENGYVFDFIALRDELLGIVRRLDHQMLLPTAHPRIAVRADAVEVEVRYAARRWVFPREDCTLLPLTQTTAELLAHWIGEQLLRALGARANRLTTIAIEVEENFGQWAIWRQSLGATTDAC